MGTQLDELTAVEYEYVDISATQAPHTYRFLIWDGSVVDVTSHDQHPARQRAQRWALEQGRTRPGKNPSPNLVDSYVVLPVIA